jgi:hypothetical protein
MDMPSAQYVGEVSPETERRIVIVAIPLVIAAGVIAAVLGNWWTAAAMGLVLAGQLGALRPRRSRRPRR